jgi:hypothetical protein
LHLSHPVSPQRFAKERTKGTSERAGDFVDRRTEAQEKGHTLVRELEGNNKMKNVDGEETNAMVKTLQSKIVPIITSYEK